MTETHFYEFIGKNKQYYEYNINLNSNCPASEKSGEGPGSCGGAKPGDKSELSEGAPKKGGGFLSKLFGGGKDEGTLTISKHDGKKLRGESDENLAKIVEEAKSVLENPKSSIADQKAAKSNIKAVEYANSFKPTSSYRGSYKVGRKY